MSNFKNWTESQAAVRAAESWISNRSKIDSQDHSRYEPVKVYNITFQYCGQDYAGANNYHESPSSFSEYLARAVNEMRKEIEDRALVLLKDDNKKRAIAAEEEVNCMLAEISKAKGENNENN